MGLAHDLVLDQSSVGTKSQQAGNSIGLVQSGNTITQHCCIVIILDRVLVVFVIVDFEIETTQGRHLTFDANGFGIVAKLFIKVIAIHSMFLVAFEIRDRFSSAVDRDNVNVLGGGVSAVFVTHVLGGGSEWRSETMEGVLFVEEAVLFAEWFAEMKVIDVCFGKNSRMFYNVLDDDSCRILFCERILFFNL